MPVSKNVRVASKLSDVKPDTCAEAVNDTTQSEGVGSNLTRRRAFSFL